MLCFTFCTILFMSEFSVQTAWHFKENSNYYLNEKGKNLHNPLPLNEKEWWNVINFSLWRTGRACLRWCGSSDAVKMCWRACASRLQLLTAAFTEILSLMAALCGKETQLWVQAGRMQSPPSLRQQALAFPAVHLLWQGRTGMNPTMSHRKAFLHLPGNQRGICSCLGFIRILCCSDKQPGWAIGKGNMFI